MKKITISAFVIASMMMFSACNSNQNEDSTEQAEERNEEVLDDKKLEDDSEFAVSAANGGMMEVKLGELAQTRGLSPQVKEFGKMMVEQHSKANEELKALAKEKNIALPATLGEDKQEDFEDLSMKNGKEFDKAYAEYMVDDHEEDIKAFKRAAENSNDAELRAWAGGKVAVLEEHLAMAKKMRDAVK
ncbi:DUF4142 domain-containing protein [Dyadobacter tibetensis]|uniref:DUF4142 domain-containing protein n=1 Tax=Dyadobacter tibetensis TaxID=1211851 RepID=UPI00046FDF66|nr:DUF4142 domain-containing protein [Dyadobacter tibetensis]